MAPSKQTLERVKTGLTIGQIAALYAIKKQTGESLSALIRKAVAQYLSDRKKGRKA